MKQCQGLYVRPLATFLVLERAPRLYFEKQILKKVRGEMEMVNISRRIGETNFRNIDWMYVKSQTQDKT
jgi:hypothetical protein